jgi:pyruvate dehydrogenase E2 component (dihydrolipoamide acetyltransferase)
LTDEAKARDVRVTMLGFLLKASAAALKQFPAFNASLDRHRRKSGSQAVFHISAWQWIPRMGWWCQ